MEQYHEWFYLNEKCKTGKIFARILQILSPKVYVDFILLGVYTRKLDLLVNSELDISNSEMVFYQQSSILQSIIQNLHIEPNNELSIIIDNLKTRYSSELFRVLLFFIRGSLLELEIIKSRFPVQKNILEKRHLSQTKLCPQLISICINKKKLRESTNLNKLMITWAEYDCLIDVKEDLKAGLILFSYEELHHFNISMNKGNFNLASFNKYLKIKKKKILKELFLNSLSIYKTNLTVLQKLGFHLYYCTRAIKLYMRNISIDINHSNYLVEAEVNLDSQR